MVEDECARWDYKSHPGLSNVASTCGEFIQQIRTSPDSQASALRNTKPFHAAMFRHAVPPACIYLAGEYRGSDHSCLKFRDVGMGGRTGAPCLEVERLMRDFHFALTVSINTLDSRYKISGESPEFLHDLVLFTAQAISDFQDIHPYADGNGHVARLLAWVITGHFDLQPNEWWLHDNPRNGWDDAVQAHQEGNPMLLQAFLMTTLYT